jgi:hypothetical protein
MSSNGYCTERKQLKDGVLNTFSIYKGTISQYSTTRNFFYQWLNNLEGGHNAMVGDLRKEGNTIGSVSCSAHAYQLTSWRDKNILKKSTHQYIAFPLIPLCLDSIMFEATTVKSMLFEVRKTEPQPKRVKDKSVHTFLVKGLSDNGYTQCLFGSHLVSDTTKKIYVFESEKTAVAYHAIKYRDTLVDLLAPTLPTVYLACGGGQLNILHMLQLNEWVKDGIEIILCGDMDSNKYGKMFETISESLHLKEVLEEVDTTNILTVVDAIKEAKILKGNSTAMELALSYIQWVELAEPERIKMEWDLVQTKNISLQNRRNFKYHNVCTSVYDAVYSGVTHKAIHKNEFASFNCDWLDILLDKARKRPRK